ncbi:transcriptional regulator, CdaR [Catenulispora acidiphila DSM 44928]|uniref:Transcriptional regulator, CdaR n=1 Tax=Catenulispora acidiphila (strain DSM 44928 / JCM 14897 / NBRC 102108 / NRRL B-24433 / ID139908) TaxID=479433 RepID=C7PZT6_CATAD|nr:PucR family transcriptional regulator ligand-binding domain-containing protein [Catenulispora acidiphila]ACU73601.1 transcriptional regulator, CdaR [Catenulispora acidiphila DSM 44928]
MRLRDLLDTPMPGLELLTGTDPLLEREISWVATTDLLDPGRYLNGGELVLTGLIWRREPRDSERFARAVAEAGAAAIAAGDASGAPIPRDLIRACRAHRTPLFRVPTELAFATLTEHLARHLSAERAADIGSVLERHGRLASASAAGTALAPILDLLAQDLGMPCWVLTPAGRPVAASHEPLPPSETEATVREALRAGQLPARIRRRSVFAISSGSPLTDWYLVFDGDYERWDPRRQALASKAAAVLAIERERLAARREPLRQLGADLVRLIAEDGGVAEIAARADLVGVGADTEVQAVALAGPAHHSGAILRALLEDVTEELRLRGQRRDAAADHDVPVAEFADHAVALVPNPPPDVAGHLRDLLGGMTAGLGREHLAIGVGSRRAAGLRATVDEARHALRIGRARSDQVSVIGHEELASHVLLLSGLPEDVRVAYRDRLLGPLRAYDALHRSDLEATLEAFLACSTSWTRCAEQMHVHVNTLRYRVARIEELTGRSLADLETQVDLFLALRLR